MSRSAVLCAIAMLTGALLGQGCSASKVGTIECVRDADCTVGESCIVQHCVLTSCSAIGGKCPVQSCTPLSLRCSGSTLLQCSTDGYGGLVVSECESALTCNAGSGRCDCPDGRYRCVGSTLQFCSGDGWNILEECGTAEQCDSGSGTCLASGPCTVGSYRCVGTVFEVCTDEPAWGLLESCATTALCQLAMDEAIRGKNPNQNCPLPECQPGNGRCVGAQPEVCNFDATGWKELDSTCATPALCVPTTASCRPPLCESGEERVDENDNLLICSDDRTSWQVEKPAAPAGGSHGAP